MMDIADYKAKITGCIVDNGYINIHNTLTLIGEIEHQQGIISALTKENSNLRVQIISLNKAHAKKDSKLHKAKKKLKQSSNEYSGEKENG